MTFIEKYKGFEIYYDNTDNLFKIPRKDTIDDFKIYGGYFITNNNLVTLKSMVDQEISKFFK